LASPVPQGLSEMMMSKDGALAQRRLTRLVNDNIFYFEPSDTSKPIGLIALSGIKRIQEDEHNLSLKLTMQSQVLIQLTPVTRASYVVWRDDLRQRLAGKVEIVKGDGSLAVIARSPSAHEIMPAAGPAVQKAVAVPVQRAAGPPPSQSSSTNAPGPSALPAAASYAAPTNQFATTTYGSAERVRLAEQREYMERSQAPSIAGAASPGNTVQQMVEAYQSMLKKYDDSSQERQTLMLNFQKLQEEHERLQQENQNLKMQVQKLELSKSEVERELESMVNTTEEALSKAERLRQSELELQAQVRAQFEEAERIRIENQERAVEPLLDELKEKIEKKYSELLEKQAGTNEKAVQELMNKSDKMVDDVLRQRDSVIEQQRVKIRELEENENHVQMIRSRFEDALQAQKQQWKENINELKNEYEVQLEDSARQRLAWEKEMRELEARLRMVYDEKMNQTCQVADEQVAAVRRDATAQARQWGEAKEHLMAQIVFYQQELRSRDMQPAQVEIPHNIAPSPPQQPTHSAMEGNLRTLLEAKKQECEDLKKKLVMSRTWQINH